MNRVVVVLGSRPSPTKFRFSCTYLPCGPVCRWCALRFHSFFAVSAIFACYATCFRAGLVSGKLLISRLLRSSKCLKRTDDRSVDWGRRRRDQQASGCHHLT